MKQAIGCHIQTYGYIQLISTFLLLFFLAEVLLSVQYGAVGKPTTQIRSGKKF